MAIGQQGTAPGDDGAPVDLRCSALLFRSGAVLLCHREGDPGHYVLPGGTPQQAESAARAAAREVAEETGLDVSVDRVAFVLETTSWDQRHHLIELVFLARDANPTKAPSQREARLTPQFVPLENLDKVDLRPPMAGYIRGFPRERSARLDWQLATAPWLGNLWRGDI